MKKINFEDIETMGKNEIYENYLKLNDYVMDNFDSFIIGAFKYDKINVQAEYGKSGMDTPDYVIELDNVIITKSNGLTVIDDLYLLKGMNIYRLTDDHIELAIQAVQELIKLAKMNVKSKFNINIKE